MDEEEPEEGGGAKDSSQPELSAKSKSKSPTPEVSGSLAPGSVSPIPEVDESEKSKSKSPTLELSEPALKTNESVVSEVVESVKSKSKSPTPEVPEVVESVKSKSKSPTPEVPEVLESVKSKSKSPTPEVPEYVTLKRRTTSTSEAGTNKTAPEARVNLDKRGGSLAVFRGAGPAAIFQSGNVQGFANCFLQKRSPFIHSPPQPEERRQRIASPRTPKEYIINLREDLADFQESHGLPRSRDYSFVSLGLALAQETGRAFYSLFQMFTELFPILAIVSLILRFAMDKLIEILETNETVPKIKKSIIFFLEMIAIIIPLWILIGTVVIPLISLILSIFKKIIRIKGKKKSSSSKLKVKAPAKTETCSGSQK